MADNPFGLMHRYYKHGPFSIELTSQGENLALIKQYVNKMSKNGCAKEGGTKQYDDYILLDWTSQMSNVMFKGLKSAVLAKGKVELYTTFVMRSNKLRITMGCNSTVVKKFVTIEFNARFILFFHESAKIINATLE